MKGTLHRALEQDKQKLSHRIHGFLGPRCDSFAFEFCLSARNKEVKNHYQEPEKQGENSRCAGTRLLRVRQRTEVGVLEK